MAKCSTCGSSSATAARFCTVCGNAHGGAIAPPGHQQSSPHSLAAKLPALIKAGAVAAVKSVVLSTILLSPGMLLLSQGWSIAGMTWMFLASFGMLAWTYRKPWQLSWASCLIPPVAAAASYLVQLWLFSADLPPAMLAAPAILLGLVIGFFFGRAHRVVSESGAILAQRTIAYLLVWVVSYGVTQALGMLTASRFAVRAGLVTGAFSTVVLIMVSVMLWRKKAVLGRAAKRPPISAVAQVMLFLVLYMAWQPTPPVRAQFGIPPGAEGQPLTGDAPDAGQSAQEPAGALQVLEALKPKLLDDWRRLDEADASNAFSIQSFGQPTGDADSASVAITIYMADISEGQLGGESKAEVTLTIERFDNPGVAAPPAASGAQLLDTPTHEIGDSTSPIRLRGPILKFPSQSRAMSASGRYRATAVTRLLSWQTDIPDPPDWLPEAMQTSNSAFVIGTVNKFFDEVAAGTAGTATNGAGPLVGNPAIRNLVQGVDLSPEAEAAAAATIAILIAAGLAANVAQAIAVAVASAVQSGAQVAADDIEAAVANALAQNQAAPPAGGNETATPVGARSPPIFRPDGTQFETNDKGEYWAPDDKGEWRWLPESEAREAAAALAEEQSAREAEQSEHFRAAEENLDESRRRWQERHAAERAAEAGEAATRQELERLRQAATRRGDEDLLERSYGDHLYREDGSIDPEYLARLRGTLRNRIGRDMATADPDFEDNSWGRILGETLDQSAEDATNSMMTRLVLGVGTGGWSEAFIQGRETWNAVRAAAEKAVDRGQDLSTSDALRIAASGFARNNLPVNTLQAFQRYREGKNVSWGEVGMSLVADAFSALDVAEAGTKLTGVKASDVAETVGRKVLSPDAFKEASEAIGSAGRRVDGAITAAVSKIQEFDARATVAVNRASGGALEKIGLGMPERLSPAQARVWTERKELAAETKNLVSEVRHSGVTAELDEAFAAGRDRGRAKVESFEQSVRALEQARNSAKATAADIAAAERRVRDDMVRIQADKHALNELNALNSGNGGSPTIKAFNQEIGNVYAQTDKRVINRLADEYGVRPEDVQLVAITNKAGQGGLIDPRAPGRPDPGHASIWRADGSIENSRAARSAPGTIDGPETGRLPEVQPTAPSNQKAGMDRDLTMRIRTVENGKVVYRDVPSTTTARIYNEEFHAVATGRSSSAIADQVPASHGPVESVDFKDTHLNEAGHIGDPLEIRDPQQFARRLDQATTDRLHPEAYGTGQADLDTATKDAFRGRDFSDAGGVAKTMEFKTDHWMNEAARLREMAAKPENAGIRSQLLEQASASMEEGQRQLTKQFDNMVLKRTEAMQLLNNAPGSTIPRELTERVAVLKQVQTGKLTPAQAEAVLGRMGTNTQSLAQQMSAYVEGLQKLRPSAAHSRSGPSIVIQGWEGNFRQQDATGQGG